jgi:hypothetical protein
LGRIFKAVDSVFVLRAATDCIMYVATKGEAVYLATNFDRSSKEKSRVELFETYNGTPGFPTTVFDHYGLSGVRAFDAVYTTVDGNIYRTPLQGGVSSYVFWQPRTDFVVSQGSLFFAAGSMIYGASIATGQTQTLASNRSNAQGIASDGPNFYWTETSDHPTLRDTRLIQIFRTPGNGGTIKKVGEVPTPPPPYPSGFDLHLAIDGTTAYASLFDQIYKQPLDL